MTGEEQAEVRRVIGRLGGPTKAGKLCGISKSAVSQWSRNGIPKPWMKFLKLERPDIFKDARTKTEQADVDFCLDPHQPPTVSHDAILAPLGGKTDLNSSFPLPP